MAAYDVELRAFDGSIRACRLRVDATSGERAVRELAWVMPPSPGNNLYAVYRHRRLRGRQLEGLYRVRLEDGGFGDGAGVREPRRPKPSPSHLTAERELPRTA